MEWTKTPPAGNSWYWFRCDGKGKLRAEAVLVLDGQVFGMRWPNGIRTDHLSGWWSGPLTPPPGPEGV